MIDFNNKYNIWSEHFKNWHTGLQDADMIEQFLQTDVLEPNKQRPVRRVTKVDGSIDWQWWDGGVATDPWLTAGHWKTFSKNEVSFNASKSILLIFIFLFQNMWIR